MADVNANIGVNIDTSAALANLKNLQRQISVFHTSMAKSGAAASAVSAGYQQNLINSINQSGKFSASMQNIRSTTESFTNSLEKNKLGMREYFRYSAASTKTFGRLFRTEFDTINKVARERVKTLQTQYIKMGRDANGAMRAIAVRPLALDMKSLSTQTQIAAQRQALFNQLVRQGSTNLLNFGKNTQWAGRQLMVGFTVPMTMLGAVAAKTFMKIEEQAIRFKKVYGEMFTTDVEVDKAVSDIQSLAKEFTKYGIAIEKTIQMAADAAQAGFMGKALEAQVTQATRLAILGGMEQEKALENTIALQNAFRVSTEDLASSINFLNAVENQTVLSLDDVSEAIPRVGPIITELGGDIRDLTFFLTAMKEGGVSAAQGANALKAGLGRLINPSKNATQYLEQLGISLSSIVESNVGDLRGTVMAFAKAIEPLDELTKARAVEKVFGKFQFARTLALLNNITRDGTQASRVLKLTASSVEELAILAERELGQVEDSTTFRFKKAVEEIKASIAPIGGEFLKALTPIIEIGTKILDAFNNLDSGTKTLVVNIAGIVGVIGPVFLMMFGLVANGVANLIKMFAFLGKAFSGTRSSTTDLAAQTQYMTQEQLEAAAVAASLDQTHTKLRQTFTSEASAVNALTSAYQRATVAQSGFNAAAVARTRPGAGRVPAKYASGVLSVPGPKGAGDIVPAMLSPGEAVIPAKQARKYSGIVSSLISDNVPGFRFGLNPFASMLGRSQVATRMSSENFVSALRSGGKDAKYQSAFTTGTGADYFTKAGSPNPKQKLVRSSMERDLFGLDPKTASASSRPTYGYARTSVLQSLINNLFGIKGKNFNAITAGSRGKSLDLYGDIDLVTKSSVAKRSSAYLGDSLMDYVRTVEGRTRRYPNFNTRHKDLQMPLSPMRGASQADMLPFERLGSPFGANKRPGENSYWTNAKSPYVETQTPGGFSFKEIDKVITNNPTIAKQLKAELKAAGLGGVGVSGPGFVGRLFKKMGVPGYNKGTPSVSPDGKNLNFAGINFSTKTRKGSNSLASTISMLQERGKSDSVIIKRLNYLAQKGMERNRSFLTAKDLAKNFNLSPSGQELFRGAGKSSAPQALTRSIAPLQGGYFEERKGLVRYLKNNGINPSKDQVKNLLRLQASHIMPSAAGKAKDWANLKNLVPDLGYVNNYLNRVQGSLGKGLLAKSDRDLQSLGISRKELGKLAAGKHPTSAREARALAAIARYDSKITGNYQAGLARFGLDKRISSGFYAPENVKTLEGLKASGVIQSTTGSRKPGKTQVVGGASPDNRVVAVSRGEAVLSQSSTKAIKQGNVANVPGIGRMGRFGPMRIPGAFGGIPEGQTQSKNIKFPGTPSTETAKSIIKESPLTKEVKSNNFKKAIGGAFEKGIKKISSPVANILDKAEQKRAARAETRALRAESKVARASGITSKTDKLGRTQYRDSATGKQISSAAAKERMAEAKPQKQPGRIAGGVAGAAMVGVIGASMIPGQIGEMAQQLMMPIMMMSMMLPMLLPLLANPIALAAVAIGGLAVAAFMLDQQFKENIKKAYEFERALGASSSAIEPLAKAAGNVTASEIMDRRRSGAINPLQIEPGKRTFGQTYLESEAGQALKTAVGDAINKVGRDASISKLVSQMATAVMAGALSPQQARSVIAQLAQELGDTNFGIEINAKLTQLLGPNGENLLKDPLEIKTKIIQDRREAVVTSLPEIPETTRKNTFLEEALIWVGNTFLGQDAITNEQIESPKDAKRRLSPGEIGTFVANTQSLIETQKQALDSLQIQYETDLDTARTAGDPAKIEEVKNTYQSNRRELLKQQEENVKSIQDYLSKVSNPEAVIETYKTNIKDMFKDDTLVSGLLPDLFSKLGGLEKQQQVVLFAEVLSGNVKPQVLTNLLSGENSKVAVDIITNFGGADAGSILAMADLFKDEESKTKFLIDVEGKTPEEMLKYVGAFQDIFNLTAMSGESDVVLDIYLEDEDLRNKFSNQMDKIRDLAKDGKPITLEVVQELVQKGVLDGTVEDAIRSNKEYFDSLPPSEQVEYIQSATVVANLKMDPRLQGMYEAWQIEKGGKRIPGVPGVVGGGSFSDFVRDVFAIPVTAGDDTGTDVDGATGKETTGGAKKESPYKNILKDLKELRQNAVNAAGSVQELLKWLGKGKDMRPFKGTLSALVAGGTTEEFQGFVTGLEKSEQNSLFKVTKGVAELTNKGKALQKAFNEISIGRFVIEQQRSVANSKNQEVAAKRLIAAGMDTVSAYEAVEDATFAAGIAAMKLGKKGRKELKTIVDSAKEAESAILKAMSPNQLAGFLKESLDAQIDKIQIDFEISSAGNRSIAAAAQSEIAALQFQIDDYQAGIQEIEWQETAVNEKYDKRFEALDKIKQANAQISEQQKSQLSIAQSITQGDVAGAARAIQELREKQAEQAIERQQNALELSREKELASLRSTGNQSRKQLEDLILAKQKEIFAIEEKRLEPANEQIRLLEVQKEKTISNLELQKIAYDSLVNKIESAEFATKDYITQLRTALSLLQAMAGVPQTGAASAGERMTVATRGAYLGDVPGPNYAGTAVGMLGPGGQYVWTGSAWVKKAGGGMVSYYPMGGKIPYKAAGGMMGYYPLGGMIPYKADGGMFNSVNSDSVPAMLTPGEYVIKRQMVNKYGTRLFDKLNSGAIPGLEQGRYKFHTPNFSPMSSNIDIDPSANSGGMVSTSDNSSVYNNYSVQVSVRSDANPNEIANTVISKMRQIESQKIRGNRL
jgi:TP901 family phage tail tape measure protein